MYLFGAICLSVVSLTLVHSAPSDKDQPLFQFFKDNGVTDEVVGRIRYSFSETLKEGRYRKLSEADKAIVFHGVVAIELDSASRVIDQQVKGEEGSLSEESQHEKEAVAKDVNSIVEQALQADGDQLTKEATKVEAKALLQENIANIAMRVGKNVLQFKRSSVPDSISKQDELRYLLTFIRDLLEHLHQAFGYELLA